MKIRTRLSLMFSIIASCIFIVFGITVYVFSAEYRKNDFQDRLRNRVVVSEKMFLEKETFSPLDLEKITNQFLHKLPLETEEFLELSEGQRPTFTYSYPQWAREEMVEKNTFGFENEGVEGQSRIFEVQGKSYLIIVTAVDEMGLEELSFLRYRIILLILIGVPLIFAGSFAITKRALLPLSKKIEHANAIGASNLDQRLLVYNPNDEIGKVAIAFNNLLDRLESSFESQKAFISNASHEMKNPLTAIMGEAEIAISKSRSPEEYIDSLNSILLEAERLNLTVNNLLQLSKITASEGSIRMQNLQFDDVLIQIKESFDFQEPNNQVFLEIAPKTKNENYELSGNVNLLKTAIINILDNACKFSNNGRVDVKLIRKTGKISLSIMDKGIGIDIQDIEKITTPFYRGKNALRIKGSGIGLALSSKIIEIHKGKLELRSQLGEGTSVNILFPLTRT